MRRCFCSTGIFCSIQGFIRESENISYRGRRKNIEGTTEWMAAVLRSEEDDESLKLRILTAISDNVGEGITIPGPEGDEDS